MSDSKGNQSQCNEDHTHKEVPDKKPAHIDCVKEPCKGRQNSYSLNNNQVIAQHDSKHYQEEITTKDIQLPKIKEESLKQKEEFSKVHSKDQKQLKPEKEEFHQNKPSKRNQEQPNQHCTSNTQADPHKDNQVEPKKTHQEQYTLCHHVESTNVHHQEPPIKNPADSYKSGKDTIYKQAEPPKLNEIKYDQGGFSQHQQSDQQSDKDKSSTKHQNETPYKLQDNHPKHLSTNTAMNHQAENAKYELKLIKEENPLNCCNKPYIASQKTPKDSINNTRPQESHYYV